MSETNQKLELEVTPLERPQEEWVGRLQYEKSFLAKLALADDNVRNYYAILATRYLSYDKVKSRTGWAGVSFSHRRNKLAMITINGKTLCLYLAIDPATITEGKFRTKDTSALKKYEDTPVLLKIKSGGALRYALKLIEEQTRKQDMNDYAKMTSLQAQEEMEKFREVFNVVRLIDADTLRETNDEKVYVRRKAEAVEPCDKCYDFWGKRNPCENCVAFAALVGKTQKSKLEIAGETIYQVMARYVEIDGKPYAMELIKRLDDDAVLDFKGHEKLINRLNDYYEKIYKDVLTGAYNRRYYEEQIKQTSLSCGVAMVDLDDFKIYNDVYGHVAGDAVLKAVASVMKKSVRKSDKVIRYGGDEFLLIMPEIHEEPFLRALSDIRQSVHGIDVPGYTEIQVSVSIGGVICENEAIDEALERADKLLYLAKEQKNALVSERDVRSGFTGGKNTKPTVLIVDDAQLNREILTSILKEEFNVIEAETAKRESAFSGNTAWAYPAYCWIS